MQVIIHAGLPKTGSSAIQKYLYTVREPMAAAGVIYPDLDHRAHWQLSVALAGSRHDKPGKAKPEGGYLTRRVARADMDRDQTLEGVAETIRAAGTDGAVILSHENFSVGLTALKLRKFLATTVPDARLHVIAYARAPISYYPSGLQQSLKASDLIQAPGEWRSGHKGRIEKLRRVFGEAVVPHAYDRSILADGDVVQDFRVFVEQVTGRSLPPIPESLSTNESMSAPICALLLRYRKAHGAGKRYGSLRRALLQFSRERNDPKLKLPDSWRDSINANNHEGWNSTVELMPYDEATKQRLRIEPPTGPIPEVGVADLEAWIEAQIDPEFTRAFAERADKAAKRGRDKFADISAWLKTQLP